MSNEGMHEDVMRNDESSEEIISWTGRDGQLKTGTKEDQKQYIEELSQEK